MDKIRIYAVAQELGIPSQELLAYFEEDGHSFSSHLAMVDSATADRARSYFKMPNLNSSETVLAPAPALSVSDALDFAPFQVEVPNQVEESDVDDELFAASQEAVAKVEQKVAAAAQAPVRQSLRTSTIATASVALAPTFVAFSVFVFGQPQPRPFLGVLLSILLTAGAIVVGSAIWATQPESSGFSFGDLMLWSWVRREAAERALIENTAILGFDRFGRFLGNSTASAEEQMRAVREIGAALDAKSSYTLGHSRRVEKHVRKVAEVLALSADDTAALATAAALHDIGNIQIPDAVLRKTGELTIEERSAIEAHVLLGARMVLKAGGDEVVDGIRHHHERWDGAGYPDGQRGEEIPLFARIIGIAEAYDAMTSTRPYRQGFSREHAIAELRTQSGLQFDGDLVEMFVSTLPEPLSIVRKFPLLGRAQTQLHELQLLFKRMGAVAVSATASTIAIALILGGTVLSPGTSDAPELAEKHRRVTPIDRVLASRLSNETSYAPTSVVSVALAPRGATAPIANVDETRLASLDGGLDVTGDAVIDDGGNGSNDGGNAVTDPISGGTVNPGPGTGSGGSTGGSAGSGSTGSGGSSTGGDIARNDGRPSNNTPPPAATTNPPPAADNTPPAADNPPAATTNPPPAEEGKGKGNGNGNGVGNGGTPPGHAEDKPGNGGGNGVGNGGTPPGHAEDKPGNGVGNGGTPPGQSEDKPGNGGGSDNAGGNGNGNAGGNSGNSNAGGSSDTAPGNSGNSNAGGNGNSGGAGVGAGAGASADAPGNSENSNAGGNGNGPKKDGE